MKHWFVAGFLAVIALALALRLTELRLRPLHNDEAVNIVKFRALWQENNYKYDPNEFHGPTLPYFTLPAAGSSRTRDFNNLSEAVFRCVPALFGAGLVLLLLLLTRDLGRAETLWAALFTAISPALVYYSRDYIHETLLLFFTALAGVAAWRYAKGGKLGWAALAGLALGLMWATKETFVFAVLSMALAVACAVGWTRWRDGAGIGGHARLSWKSLALALGMAVVVSALFFSSFFSNGAGIAASVATYTPWLHRAEGVSPHAHSWSFYFERLLIYRAGGGPVASEGLIFVLAAVGFVVGLAGRGLGTANVLLMRVIAFYTAWMTFIYTLLPYKTPWCLIEFYFGMILLAGVGAAVLLRWRTAMWWRIATGIVLTAATVQLFQQTWRENFGLDKGGAPYCASLKNPYAYSQTSADVLHLAKTLDGLAAASPEKYDTVVEVMSAESYWPLPWYLRRFTNIGYWDKIPDQPLAPIIIVSTQLQARFDERPEKTHLMAGYFELRPGVFLELYVSTNLWGRYVKTLPPEAD